MAATKKKPAKQPKAKPDSIEKDSPTIELDSAWLCALSDALGEFRTVMLLLRERVRHPRVPHGTFQRPLEAYLHKAVSATFASPIRKKPKGGRPPTINTLEMRADFGAKFLDCFRALGGSWDEPTNPKTIATAARQAAKAIEDASKESKEHVDSEAILSDFLRRRRKAKADKLPR